MKKMNLPALLFGAFVLFVLAKRFLFGTSGETEKAETSTAPAEEVSGLAEVAAKSELGQLFSTLDWTVTTPGKAVAELLGGAGWANWLLWTAVAVLVLLVVRSFFKPKGDSGFGWSVLMFIWAGLIAVALYAAITAYGSREIKNHVVIDFRHAQIGQTADVRLGFSSVAVVRLRNANLQKDGDVYFWACPETIWPVKLPFAPKLEVVAGAYTSQNHLALTAESKQALMENGTSAIDIRFTFQAARENPCQNLKQKGSS